MIGHTTTCEVEGWIALKTPNIEDDKALGYMPRKAVKHPREGNMLKSTNLKGIVEH